MYSEFLIGCNPPNVIAHDRTNAFKEMRRLVRGLRKGPINPTRYKCFSVITLYYITSDFFQISIVNKKGATVVIDNLNYPSLKTWVENIKDDTLLKLYSGK